MDAKAITKLTRELANAQAAKSRLVAYAEAVRNKMAAPTPVQLSFSLLVPEDRITNSADGIWRSQLQASAIFRIPDSQARQVATPLLTAALDVMIKMYDDEIAGIESELRGIISPT